MTKYIALFVIIASCFSCSKQESKGTTESAKITIGTIDSVKSDVLKEQRKIWVYTPHDTTKKYPLLVLLDGDAHFQSVAGMIQQLSSINGNSIVPEMVIVGIPNTDRTRDLTPNHVTEIFGDTAFAKTSGGGENFTKFIQDELLPYVDKKYPTTKHRTLIGHSLGGLFVINTLLYHPGLFTNYLAIDPSLWWDKQRLVKESPTVLNKDYHDKALFLAVANTMKTGKNVETVMNDTSQSTFHIRSILQFNGETSKLKSGLEFNSKYYGDEDHGSVPLIAEYDGLRFLFSWYRLTGIDEYFDKAFKATPSEMISHIKEHYDNVSKHFGYQVLPPEMKINGLGYGFMGNKMMEKAFACFELNIQNYPNSANVFDSMGDYYTAQQDTVNAIANYSKALSIEKLDHTQEKLSKLRK